MLVKRYRGRVVQKMQRKGTRIELIFHSVVAGEPRERQIITQRDWDQHGSENYEEGKSIQQFRNAVQGLP